MAHVVAEEQLADPGEHVPDLVESAHQLVDLDPSRALQLAERALQHCRGTDPPELAARALDVLARARLALGRYADASTAVQEGLARSETVGDLPLRIDFLRSRLETAFFTRDHDAAIEAGNDALQLSRQSGDRRREAIVSNDLGLVYGFLQAFDEALEHLLAGLKLLQECGEQALGSHLNNIGNIYLEQGDCAEALGFFRSACETFRVHQPGTGEAIALGNIARAHRRTGSGEEAVLAARASLELFERHAAHAYLPPALARLAEAHAVAGDLVAARNRFEAAITRLQSNPDREFEDDVLRAAGEFYVRQKEPETAIPLLRRALERCVAGKELRRTPEIHRLLADAHEARDEYELALRHVREQQCDIDHFKAINDRISHLVGDEVLRIIGALLKGNVRREDVVARFGGEEFLVVLPETSLQDARIVAERLRTAVNRQPWAEVHPDLSVTVSIGIAALEGGEGPRELIAAADARLYEAKGAGRNTICA